MTKVIAAVIVVALLYGGWEFFLYWERVKSEEEAARKQAAATVVVPEQLPGLPQKLETSLKTAQDHGAPALKKWLRAYGASVHDPRKAWIELDYCLLVSHDDPAEAKRVFAAVKERTLPSSPVYPRVKQLEKTYQ
jgi:hypothetical protein